MKVMGSSYLAYLDAGIAENLVDDIPLEDITTHLGGTARCLPLDTYFGKVVNIARKATETLEVQEAGTIKWTVAVEAGTEILLSARFGEDGPDDAQAQVVALEPTTYTADAGRLSGGMGGARQGNDHFRL